jgi:hypothetical protein
MAEYRYLLMAERTDGTGRMVYSVGNDRARLEEIARQRTTPRTRFWVEEAVADGLFFVLDSEE